MTAKEYDQGFPDHNLSEMQWQDLKRAVHEQMPTNLDELKQ